MPTKQEHLRLLAKAWFSQLVWSDAYGYGGWMVDLHRPFGNSSVEEDILDLLGFETHEEFQDTYPFWETDYATELYKELGSYLKQIGENL